MKFFKLICFAVCAALIASCASAPTIKTQVVHPPLADMSGIKTITVVPLELRYAPDSTGKKLVNVLWSALGASYSQDKFTTAQFLTSEFVRYIQAANLYTVVPYTDKLLTSVPVQVDAFLTGEITDLTVSDDSSWVKEKRNGIETKVTYYTRSVRLEVSYSIVRAKDNVILFQDKRYYTQKSDKTEYKLALPAVQTLSVVAATKIVATIGRVIAPWTSFETYELEKDKLKDPRMETAQGFVENSMFDRALTTYADIYNTTGNPAAGYNAAILLDITGDTKQAIKVLEGLLNNTTDSNLKNKIIKQMARMQGKADEQQTLRNYAK